MPFAFHLMSHALLRLTLVLFSAILAFVGPAVAAERHSDFDVVVAGGSTAALAAAVSAAQSGAKVALLEPTDWIGGQITSSGVPAIDEAWHKLKDENDQTLLDVAKIARTPENISPLLRRFLSETGCPGNCWVSRFCFEPKPFIDRHLAPLEKSLPTLRVFRETVVKRCTTKDERIVALKAIQRFPDPALGNSGYDVLPSQDLPDWYSQENSGRFRKVVHEFASSKGLVFIDATEWGELLALSNAAYLIGVESTDGGLHGNESIGQSITYGFVQELHADENSKRDRQVPRPKVDQLGLGDYRDKPNAWDLVWTYRRLRAAERDVAVGDLSLQNWGYYVEKDEGGNDYPFGYLFLNRAQTARQLDDWMGGVDLDVMSAAEERAFAWHHWFKERTPARFGKDRVSLATDVMGTSHGLSKLPYIRDTRRSIGLDNFLLTVKDLAPTSPGEIAKHFDDRICLGAYPVDIHPMEDVQISWLRFRTLRCGSVYCAVSGSYE